MKTIETLDMDEEMGLSPSGVNLDSPSKAEDAAFVDSESSDDESGLRDELKDEILTNNSLEEALDKQLASLEEEEEEEEEETEKVGETVPKTSEEVTETDEETIPKTSEVTETDEETIPKTSEVTETDEETIPKPSEVTKTDEETFAKGAEEETELAGETISDDTKVETDKTAEVEQTDICDTENMDENTEKISDSEEKTDGPMTNESQIDNTVNIEELNVDSKGEFKYNVFYT